MQTRFSFATAPPFEWTRTAKQVMHLSLSTFCLSAATTHVSFSRTTSFTALHSRSQKTKRASYYRIIMPHVWCAVFPVCPGVQYPAGAQAHMHILHISTVFKNCARRCLVGLLSWQRFGVSSDRCAGGPWYGHMGRKLLRSGVDCAVHCKSPLNFVCCSCVSH